MDSRGMGMISARRLTIALAATLSVAAAAHAGNRQAIERFRAAAALQQRELFDLAATDYDAIERDFATDPVADRARLARGVCLFQLGKFAEAAAALKPLAARQVTLADDQREQLLAYLGLSQYNLGRSAQGADADRQLDSAIDTLQSELRTYPDGRFASQAAFFAAEALYSRQRVAEAAEAYRSLAAKYPRHPQRAEAIFGLAVAEHERQHFAAAAAAYARFEQEFPQHSTLADVRARHADLLLSHAEQLRTAGKPLDARRVAEQLLTAFPENANVPPAFLVIAQIELADQNLAAAETSLDQCLRRSTHPAVTRDAYLLRARVRCECGNSSGSLADASAVLVRDPDCIEALHLRGLAESAVGRSQDAVQTLAKVLATDSHYAETDRVLYELAWAHEQNQESGRAAETYAQLIDRFPHSPLVAECQFRIGQINFASHKFAAAAGHFRAAHAAASDASLRDKAIHQLAWCQFNEGDFAAARQSYEAQIAAQPTGPLSADAQAMAGECCFKTGQFSAALDHFTAAIGRLDAESALRPLALRHASESAAEMHNWQRSLELAERALQEFHEDDGAGELHYLRGAALLELGQLETAHRELADVGAHGGLLKLKTELAQGRIHAARGECDEAVRLFFKAAYGQGGNQAPEAFHDCQAQAIIAAARALEASGRHEAAHKLYQELVADYPTSDHVALAKKSLEETVRR